MLYNNVRPAKHAIHGKVSSVFISVVFKSNNTLTKREPCRFLCLIPLPKYINGKL